MSTAAGSAVVADTHAIIWYLTADLRLSALAKLAMDAASAAGQKVYVPTISIVEATYLTEKGRLTSEALFQLQRAILGLNGAFENVPLTVDIALTLASIPRDAVPDMPDRIIAATALALRLPLVTCDSQITAAAVVQTIW